MKKQYIQPITRHQITCFANCICVGSVHGNSPLHYGGGSNGGGENGPI